MVKVKNKVIERVYPLTPTQEGMLFHKILDETSTSYVVQEVMSIHQELNEALAAQALELLTIRHRILRTAIVYRNVKTPQQVILIKRKIEFEGIDLSHLSSEEQQVGLEKIAAQDVQRGFDLEKDSLLRMKVIKFGVQDYKMIWSFHHIIIDGWCLSIISSDFMKYYLSLKEGIPFDRLSEEASREAKRLPDYEDYIKWLKKQDIDEGLNYWNHLLRDYRNVAQIIPDGSVSEAKSPSNQAKISYSEELSEQIKNACAKHQITVNTLFEIAWGKLLQRYTNENDVVFGKVVSGRNIDLIDAEKIVGLFINTIPVRIKWNEEDTFESLAIRIGRQAVDSSRFDYCPLVSIQKVNELKFNTLMVFENYFEKSTDDQLHVKTDHFREETNYPLSLVIKTNDVFVTAMMFDTNQYSLSEINRILIQLQMVIEEMIAHPKKKLHEIEVVTDMEKQQLLNSFNNTKTDYPKDQTIHELFEDQVKRNPDREAVITVGERVSYSDLNQRANELLGELKRNGVAQDSFVGIVTEKSVDMIAGMLAILKNGCSYVPINPDDPANRLRYMIAECRIETILCGDQNRETIEAAIQANVLSLHGAYSEEGDGIQGSATDGAYVIFTSGSTGQPKGVHVEHRNVVRLVKNQHFLPLEEARILQTGTLSFDASTFEIWGALLNGGMVCLMEPSLVTSSNELRDATETYQINTMWMTAQLFNNLVDSDLEMFAPLQYLIIGGERLSESHVRQFTSRHETKLINGYGPTENTTFSLYHPIQKGDNRIPIGRPLQNSTAYILNGEQLCGIGMPGELCVGGDGVARGYLNRPELTREKFVTHPYLKEERIYRTGDLARWLPDGTIEYLGRIDDQVKIRGFRIEPGEIENVIKRQKGILDAAVVAKANKVGDLTLCAYIVYKDNEAYELKKELRNELPEYMMPAYVFEMEQLPVTRNGKLDKRSLPEPAFTSVEKYVAPRNETEATLVKIFQEVLGLDKVSIADDFFEIGGHSLRSTRVMNLIDSQLGVRLPLPILFNHPTVEQLSEQIKLQGMQETYHPIPKAKEKDYYAMSSQQKRLFILNEIDDLGTVYNIPGVMELSKKVNIDKIQTICEQLVERHEALRTSFHVIEGEPVQKIANVVPLKVEYEESEQLDPEQVEEKLQQFVRPFDLAKAPLFRMKVMKGIGKSFLMFDLHHIISDGASMNIITKEFSDLYNGKELASVDVHYKDYSEWINQKDLDPQKDYWLGQFSEEIPVLDLPVDFPRPRKRSYKGKTLPVILDKEAKETIQTLCKETKTTEYMVFLAAFMVLLQKYSGQEDLVVGSPISGRTHKDTEQMLGMFVNTLAMRGRPVKAKTFAAFLAEIKETTVKAYENQEYPFEDLVEQVEVTRDLSRNPLFDCMLVLQNQGHEEISLNQVQVGEVASVTEVAKFDLTLNIDLGKNGYLLKWEYCTDLFEKETIERFANQFTRFLSRLPEQVNKQIREIDFLTSKEKAQLLYEFNAGDVPYPKDQTIKDLFEHQVDKHPDQIVLEHGTERLTYAELDKKANKIANQLISLGVEKNDVVAFSLPRSCNLLATILGILKSGAGFLPVENHYPVDRLQFILKDSQAKLLITEKQDAYPTFDGCFQITTEELYNYPESQLPTVEIQPNQLCYCIYTSGSTGAPKGVKISHQNLVNYLMYGQQEYVTAKPVMPFFTNVGFDLTMTSVFIPLCFGGKLFIYNQGIEKDIYEVFKNEELTIIKLTPSHLNIVCEPNKKQVLPQLTCLIVGGEELTAKTAQATLDQFGDHIYIHNEYGPTETTIGCCDYIYNPNDSHLNVSIGKAISNMDLHILDGNQLCGVGMPGEICVGGDGVSAGYINKQQLTNEKFVTHPYITGKRIYRTGDLGRWRTDGTVEFLGRIDEQVKIRGRRIELGEISNLIKKQPSIQDAVVILKENPFGEKVLCAYVITEEDFNEQPIIDALRYDLPEYMIPAYLLKVDRFELTRNGKLDKRSLPEPSFTPEKQHKASETEMERMLVDIFEPILGVTNISVAESFFDLGGNSLKAIKVASKLSEKGYHLSVVNLFNLQTIEKVAVFLAGDSVDGEKAALTSTLGLNEEKIKVVQVKNDVIAFVDDDILERNPVEILNELGKDYSIKVNYLFPLSEYQANREIDFILTKLYSQPEETELLNKVKDKLLRYTKLWMTRPIKRKEQLSPIQKLSYTMGIRSSFAEIQFQNRVDIPKLERAFVNLLQLQPILNTSINISKNEVIEVKCPEAINIPFVDLSYVTQDVRQAVIKQTLELYQEYDREECYNGDRLMHQAVLIKKDETNYSLIVLCSHLIFDGFSNENFENQLLKFYYDESHEIGEKAFDYFDYVKQIKKGPQNTSQAEIYNKLQLGEFKQAVKNYQKATENLKFEQVQYTFHMETDALEKGRSHSLEVSEALYMDVLRFFFPESKIPIFVVQNGRKYMDQSYYEHLGEFIDFIPHVVDPNNAESITGEIEDKLNFIQNHNINMSAIFSHAKMQLKYPRVVGAFLKINPKEIKLPIYNNLMVYENLNDVDEINEELEPTLSQEQNMISVLFYKDQIQISTFCVDGQKEALEAFLKETLSKRLHDKIFLSV